MLAYRLVKLGRLWQLAVEKWMMEQWIESIPDMSQMFVRRDDAKRNRRINFNVVEDFLIAGSSSDIE